MHLQCTIETATGVEACYWRLGSITIRLDRNSADLYLHGWPSEAAFLSGRQPLEVREITLRPAEYAGLLGTPQAAEVLASLLGHVAGTEAFQGGTIVA